jgi:transcription antitermination factor NusG
MVVSSTWYAVYTKPRWEKKVAELFKKKRLEHYCPLNKVQRQWHDRKKWVEEPLFTSYVFVKISNAELTKVRETPGVVNFVYWLNKPAVIREEEIISIQNFLENFGAVTLERTSVNINDRVRVVNGPLMNVEGDVVEVNRHHVKITLPSLGFALTALVEKSSVEMLPTIRKLGATSNVRMAIPG